MENPFLKRATEYLRDHEAFLAIVSPEPIRHFIVPAALTGELYDRLVIIQGTPGSGKTTLASLFEFPRLSALVRTPSLAERAPLLAAMNEAAAITEERPRVFGCRLPLESGYRALWEFPYSSEVRLGLCASLIQARAVLAWFRNAMQAGIPVESVRVLPRPDAGAALEAIGGVEGPAIHARAKEVERALYGIAGSLVPPELASIDAAATNAYAPFDVIERFEIDLPAGPAALMPLVILDDAQSLHPEQFDAVKRWLARREIKLARWVLTRLDVMTAGEALTVATEERQDGPPVPGLAAKREICSILLQGGDERRQLRTAFRKTAADMASRYMHHMQLFARRKLVDLGNLLSSDPEPLSKSNLERFNGKIAAAARRLRIAERRVESLRAEVQSYAPHGKPIGEDVRAAMLGVLLQRYANRVPQPGLFGPGDLDVEPSRPLKADVEVFDAARIRLLHEFDRPYYFGLEDLCDASSENAEQFLHLAAALVELIAGNVIRAKSAVLSSRTQHQQLRRKASEMFASWDFPRCDSVRALVSGMASECVAESLSENGWLGAGANAFGVPQEQFETVAEADPDLAEVLKFALAYNAINLVPRYTCKNKLWCLVELGGVPRLHFGLTLKRGGFLERDVASLARLVRAGGS